MKEVSIIGLDLAKNVFQAHGAAADGSVVFRLGADAQGRGLSGSGGGGCVGPKPPG